MTGRRPEQPGVSLDAPVCDNPSVPVKASS